MQMKLISKLSNYQIYLKNKYRHKYRYENCDDNDDISEFLSPDYLNTLSPSSLPPHELRLRPNCITMLIRNLNISGGLCNGIKLMIIELADH